MERNLSDPESKSSGMNSVGRLKMSQKQNWVNELLDEVVRSRESWPEWMKSPAVRTPIPEDHRRARDNTRTDSVSVTDE